MSESPSEVFSAFADPTRVAILKALWAAKDHEASFSELLEAVEVTDSGRFNYHISKLRGRLITNIDGSYRFRLAGMRLVGGLLSGAYPQTGEAGPVPIGHDFLVCGGERPVSLRGRSGPVRRLRGDPGRVRRPPGVFAGVAREEVPAIAERYGRTLLQQRRQGFCVNCEGRVDPTVVRAKHIFPSATDDDVVPDDLPFVEFECRRCGETVSTDLGNALCDHPDVVSFYYDHGIDATGLQIWDLLAIEPGRAAGSPSSCSRRSMFRPQALGTPGLIRIHQKPSPTAGRLPPPTWQICGRGSASFGTRS